MGKIDQVLKRAGRRMLVQRWLDWLAVCLLVCVLIAGLMLMARLWLLVLPTWAFGAVFGVAVLASIFLAAKQRPARGEVARQVDQRLDLKDHLATAVFAAEQSSHPFAQVVIDNAEARAEQITSLRSAFGYRLGRTWLYVLGCSAALCGVSLYLVLAQPDPFGKRDQQLQQAARELQQKKTTEHMVQANLKLQQINAKNVSRPKTLRQMKRQLDALSRKQIKTDAQRDKALEQLAQMRQRIIQQREQKEQQLRWMRNTMSRLNTTEDGPANNMLNAMQRGDFDAARLELKRLSSQMNNGQMTQPEKEKLSKQFSELEEQFRQAAAKQAAKQEQLQNNIRQSLEQAGLNEQQINQLSQQQFSPDQVQQMLEQAGQTAEQAREQSQQVSQQAQQMQQHQNQQQTSESLSQAMNQMCSACNNTQGQPGDHATQGQQFSQAADAAQQQLAQMQQSQRQSSQMDQAQSQMQQAMQQLGQSGNTSPQSPASQSNSGTSPAQPANPQPLPGTKASSETGSHPLGASRNTGRINSYTEKHLQQGDGKVLTTMQKDGATYVGDLTAEIAPNSKEAADHAERALNNNRVPKRFRKTLRNYFAVTEDKSAKPAGAPAAPE